MSDDRERRRFRARIALASLVGLLLGLALVLRMEGHDPASANPYVWRAPSSPRLAATLAQPEPPALAPPEAETAAPANPWAAELDVEQAFETEGHLEQNLEDGTTVVLTVRPAAQRRIEDFLASYPLPFAAVVAVDPTTGDILALVEKSQQASDTPGLAIRPFAPAASIFKIVTAAALLEDAGVDPGRRVCYHGGRQRLTAAHLLDDPKRDTLCATLGEGLASSTNALFAKLAANELPRELLRRRAQAFGFDRPLPFSRPVEISTTSLPSDRLEYARAAAGFHHVHLSALHAALIAGAIANGGEMMSPRLANARKDAEGQPLVVPPPVAWGRAVSPENASRLAEMMEGTVTFGTAARVFAPNKRPGNLAGLRIAGKTGSLSGRGDGALHYSWFVGFAPIEAPRVALAVVVANPPEWFVKAPTVAREALSALLAD